jgi:hypothetical protein
MKILLTVIMCSSMANTCLDPYTFPNGYVDEYECMLDGYIKSHDKILEIGRSEINTHGIYVKFDCSEVIIPKPKPGIES